ncbi:MAG: hypothetical protein PHW27_05075 [Melioribacteraceae bacterium]|nr:hypothetical protein [Melioribacteraceae bacterium]
MKLLLVLLFAVRILSAQSSLEKFLSVEWSIDKTTLYEVYDKSVLKEEKILSYSGVTYQDSLKGEFAKYLFLFNSEYKLIGKAIGNISESETEVEYLFPILKTIAINKFGNPTSESEMMGMLMLSWEEHNALNILLNRMKTKCMLMILKK